MSHYGFYIFCNAFVLEDIICVYKTILQINRSSYKENITAYVMISGRESIIEHVQVGRVGYVGKGRHGTNTCENDIDS